MAPPEAEGLGTELQQSSDSFPASGCDARKELLKLGKKVLPGARGVRLEQDCVCAAP